jgi:hypothetical protein
LLGVQVVAGSNPVAPTIKEPGLAREFRASPGSVFRSVVSGRWDGMDDLAIHNTFARIHAMTSMALRALPAGSSHFRVGNDKKLFRHTRLEVAADSFQSSYTRKPFF